MTKDRLKPIGVLARNVGLPAGWLLDEAWAGRIPSLRVGRKVLFNVDAVQRVLLQRAAELSKEATGHSIEEILEKAMRLRFCSGIEASVLRIELSSALERQIEGSIPLATWLVDTDNFADNSTNSDALPWIRGYPQGPWPAGARLRGEGQ